MTAATMAQMPAIQAALMATSLVLACFLTGLNFRLIDHPPKHPLTIPKPGLGQVPSQCHGSPDDPSRWAPSYTQLSANKGVG